LNVATIDHKGSKAASQVPVSTISALATASTMWQGGCPWFLDTRWVV